jgi:hypothetical protein
MTNDKQLETRDTRPRTPRGGAFGTLKRASLLMPAAFLLSALYLTPGSSGGPPTPLIPMRANFVDGLGYKVESDNPPANTGWDYVDGVNGVEVNINPSTGDFRINLNTSRKPARVMRLFLDDLVVTTSCGTVALSGALPTQATFLNVGIGSPNLQDIAPGEEGILDAFFATNNGVLRMQPLFDFGSYSNCSGQVRAIRHLNGTTWDILPLGPADDEAVLVQSKANQVIPVGYFNLPFALKVEQIGP